MQKARLAQEIAARMTQAASIQKPPAPAPDANPALSLAAVAQAAANQLAQQARPPAAASSDPAECDRVAGRRSFDATNDENGGLRTVVAYLDPGHPVLTPFSCLQRGMAVAPIPQTFTQPKVPSMWAQPGSYQPEADKPHFESELEINDFPQHARWKVGCFSHYLSLHPHAALSLVLSTVLGVA